MKHLIPLTLLVLACGGSPLAELADKVPEVLHCAPRDGDAEALLLEYAKHPETVIASLTAWGKRDPFGLACTLLDVKNYLERTGQRASNEYKRVIEALKELSL